MEITEKNNGSYLGFKDNETAIFINEENYQSRFQEFLNDSDNPKWKKIAEAGKNYSFKKFSNDVAIDSLVKLMEEII